MRRSVPLLTVLFLTACGHAQPRRVDIGGRVEVWQIPLTFSNVHVVRSGRAAVLVDAGSPGDLDEIAHALGAMDMKLTDLRLAVLTHGHGDHASSGAALQARGVPVMAGVGDVAMTRAGHNDDLRPQNLTGFLTKPFFDFRYAPFTPNEIVEDRRTLAKWGLPFVEVDLMAGHTAGSLVVILPRGDAIVGDMIHGGWFGGALFADAPGEHYYQADSDKNRANIHALLGRGVRRFHLGHGGPVDADAVRTAYGD